MSSSKNFLILSDHSLGTMKIYKMRNFSITRKFIKRLHKHNSSGIIDWFTRNDQILSFYQFVTAGKVSD